MDTPITRARFYRDTPDAFVADMLGIPIYDVLAEVLWAVRDNKYTTVAGCWGSGKTFDAALVVLWYLLTHEDSRVVTTAPTDRQVRDLLWSEIRAIHRNAKVYLGGVCLQERLTIRDKWFAVGFTASAYNESSFQGYHAPEVLFVMDEAAGVSPMIWDGADRLCIGDNDRVLALGNPTDAAGRFGRSHRNAEWRKIKIDAFRTPNLRAGNTVIPGMVTTGWVEEKTRIWGVGSPAFKVKVLAEFPEESDTRLIPLSWLTRSYERHADKLASLRRGDITADQLSCLPEKVCGADISQGGDDECVFYRRTGTWVENYRVLSTNDLVQVANELEMEAALGYYIVLDANGVGAGVYDILRSRGIRCSGSVGSRKSTRSDSSGLLGFANTRSENLWNLRTMLNPANDDPLDVPEDDLLTADLTAPNYHSEIGAKICVEPKEDVKAKLGRSPDRGDALALCASTGSYEGPPIVSHKAETRSASNLRAHYGRAPRRA